MIITCINGNLFVVEANIEHFILSVANTFIAAAIAAALPL
jgi:hypothetical protein